MVAAQATLIVGSTNQITLASVDKSERNNLLIYRLHLRPSNLCNIPSTLAVLVQRSWLKSIQTKHVRTERNLL